MTQLEWEKLEAAVGQMSVEEKRRLIHLVNTSLEKGGDVRAESTGTIEEFDAELASLTFEGPTLPADFSRADVYSDHD